jgi:hypothetical protein
MRCGQGLLIESHLGAPCVQPCADSHQYTYTHLLHGRQRSTQGSGGEQGQHNCPGTIHDVYIILSLHKLV